MYRQGVEALTRHKLNIAKTANGDVSAVEKQLNEGHIEESLDIASDELSLAAKMVEWKSCVIFPQLRRGYLAHFKLQLGTFGRETRTWSMGIRWRDNIIIIIALLSSTIFPECKYKRLEVTTKI